MKKEKEQMDMEEVNKLVGKYKSLQEDNKLDLSADEDLSIAVMNLISIEEHLFFSGAKTENPAYYQLLKEIREMRKGLLKKIIKEYDGEVWCISKHLLASSYRIMEYGTKHLGQGDEKTAQEMFEKAYNLYSLFWALNTGLITKEKLSEKEK